jgi:hypothetical protein
VDFTSVARSGEKAGLDTLGLVTQRDFLSNLGLDRLPQQLASQSLTPRQIQANRAGITDLVRPGGLGEFKVLAQGKNVGTPALWGLKRSDGAASLVESLPAPLLTEHHLSLPDGRNLGGEQEFETFWPT